MKDKWIRVYELVAMGALISALCTFVTGCVLFLIEPLPELSFPSRLLVISGALFGLAVVSTWQLLAINASKDE